MGEFRQVAIQMNLALRFAYFIFKSRGEFRKTSLDATRFQ